MRGAAGHRWLSTCYPADGSPVAFHRNSNHGGSGPPWLRVPCLPSCDDNHSRPLWQQVGARHPFGDGAAMAGWVCKWADGQRLRVPRLRCSPIRCAPTTCSGVGLWFGLSSLQWTRAQLVRVTFLVASTMTLVRLETLQQTGSKRGRDRLAGKRGELRAAPEHEALPPSVAAPLLTSCLPPPSPSPSGPTPLRCPSPSAS